MKRSLLAAALVLFGADLAYGQTCQAYINGVHVRMQASKWDDAVKVLEENMDQCGDIAEFHYLLGISMAQADDDNIEAALVHISRADELNADAGPDDELQVDIDRALQALWGPMVNEGIRMLTAGDLDGADQKLTKAVEVNPDGKEGHLGLGAVRHAQDDLDGAIRHYERAIEIDPAYEVAVLRLGIVLQQQADGLAAEDPARAEATAARAAEMYAAYVEENPDAIDVQVQLAGLYAGMGQMERAEPVIRKIMESDSVSAQTLTDFGFRLANAQQYELAEEILARAIQATDSLNSEPLSYQAFVQIQTGDLEQAKAVLVRQAELEPANSEAWENLGFVLRDLGEEEAAAEAFQKAENIPIALEQLSIGQNPDKTWNVEATFSNRKEVPIENVGLKFSLLSTRTGEVVETMDAAIAGEPLRAGQAERVSIEFTTPVDDVYVKYELVDAGGVSTTP